MEKNGQIKYEGDKMIKNQAVKTDEVNRQITSLTAYLLNGITAFIISISTLAGELSPLNVAIVACSNITGGIAAFAASLMAYFFTGTAVEALPQICSMLAIIIIKFFFEEIIQKEIGIPQIAVLTTFIYLCFGGGILFFTEITLNLLLIRIAQGLLCGCTTYFLMTVTSSIKRENVIPVTGSAGVSLGVIFTLAISALTSIDISNFNIGRTIGLLVMLFAMKKYKHIGGVICGALTTCGVSLCSPELGKTTMLLACIGLIVGLFSEIGGFALVLSFIATNAAALVVIGITSDTYGMVFDIAIATIIFVFIPSATSSQVLHTFTQTKRGGEAIAQNAGAKLCFASKTIGEIKNSFDKVSFAMEKKEKLIDISGMVCERVCSKCKKCIDCWEGSYDTTNSIFQKLESEIMNFGEISKNTFHNDLNFCIKRNLLESDYNMLYNEIVYERKVGTRLKEMRLLLSEQFSVMQDMLTELSKELSSYYTSDQGLSDKIRAYFLKLGINGTRVCAFFNKQGKISVEAYVNNKPKIGDILLSSQISDIVERELELPNFSSINGLTKIELWEKPKFAIDIGATQNSGNDDISSGDSYELFVDNQAQAYIVLSDGMGSGDRAQLDSLMTSKTVMRLLKAGLGYSSSLRLINSSMRVKGWEESFATLDLAKIDLYTGKLELIKAGAASTYLVRGEHIKQIDAESFPIGILQEVKLAKLCVQLKTNDIILVASDGVIDSQLELIRKTTIEYRKYSSQDLSEKLVSILRESSNLDRMDDVTIIIVKINNND